MICYASSIRAVFAKGLVFWGTLDNFSLYTIIISQQRYNREESIQPQFGAGVLLAVLARFFFLFGGTPDTPGWPLPGSGDCAVPVTLGVELLRGGGAGVAATDALLALSTAVSGGTVSVAGGWSTTGRVLFVNVVLACAAVVLMALNSST